LVSNVAALPAKRGDHGIARAARETVARSGDVRLILIRPVPLPMNVARVPRRLLRIAATLLCWFAVQAHADSQSAIDVAVRVQDNEATVDVNAYVRVMPRDAWAVMTDFDHAAAFISKLEKSVILSRADTVLLVAQEGTVGYGLFSLNLATVSEIRLTPFTKMQARLISGNMKKNDATTWFIADAAGTRIVYHMESIPDAWIPPIIGRALIEFETRARFRQLVEEMLRRKALTDATR
jgi:hypothetical protein